MKNDDLDRWGRICARIVAERGVALNTLTQEREERRRAARGVKNALKAIKITQTVAKEVQTRAHAKISEIVTMCLASVFDEPYQFEIRFERKRNKTEAKLVFTKDGKDYDPKEGAGIGVTDVAAFGLRLAALMLKRPLVRKMLVADEPFKNLNGSELQKRAAGLLRRLAEEFDFQFIFVCGDGEHWLAEAGKVVEV